MTIRDTQHDSSTATKPSRQAAHVQSVERAAELLRAVAVASGAGSTATALAGAVGLNRTTTWRLLSTLEKQRLVSLDRRTGRYALGFGIIDLAGQARESLAGAAQTVLQRIAARSGETSALAVMREGALTYVAESVVGGIVSVTFLGQSVPLHATSTGKALLAFSAADEVRELLSLPRGARLPRFTATTITTRTALAEELARTRERGYSVCQGEFEESAWGVSAPVLDVDGRAVAVVSIWGPPERITAKRFSALGALAVAGAEVLAARSG